MHPKPHLIRRYGSALGAVLLACLGFLALRGLVSAELPPFLTFYPAVMLVALLAGIGPGLAATALGAFFAWYWIIPPAGHFGILFLRDALSLALFIGMGVFMSLVAEMYRRARCGDAADFSGAATRHEAVVPAQHGRSERVLIAAGMIASLAIFVTLLALMQRSVEVGNKADEWISHPQTAAGGLLSLILLGTVFLFLIQENRLRKKAEAGLLDYQDQLLELVENRTAELAQTNRDLAQEVLGHRQAREELSRSHEALEQRVEERTAELEYRHAELILEAAERGKAEAALSRSEQRYREVVEDQTELITRFRPDGSYTFVNQAFMSFFGMSRDEVLDRSWHPQLLPDDQPKPTGPQPPLSPEHPIVVMESRVVSGSGEIRWMQFVNRCFFDEEGGLLETQTVGRDITERKLLDETLRVSESKLRILFENQVYAICIFEVDSGRIIDVNEAHVAMYGYSKDELTRGMMIYDLSAEPDSTRAAVLSIFQMTRTTISSRYHRKKDGTVFPVEIVSGAYQWNGIKVMFGLFHDVTERKKAEETRERYARRLIVVEEDLRNRIAMELHDDVGQMLTALGLNLAYIHKQLPASSSEKLLSSLEDTRQLNKEISNSVRNLMVDLRPAQLDEYGLGAAITYYLQQYAQRTQIAMTVQVDPGLPRLPIKQEIALFRITQEAVNNGVKHAAATRISVSLGCDGFSYLLAISDDGQGFVPDHFSPLPAGSGWGLTIMRERAELIGGRYRLDTVPGAGTTIVIELPLVPAVLPG
jgi:PAS domain S-box-containing protein